jgi:hypothetical protein
MSRNHGKASIILKNKFKSELKIDSEEKLKEEFNIKEFLSISFF